MLVFESLNCGGCKKPFAQDANQPRSALRLVYGTTMCRECIEKSGSIPISLFNRSLHNTLDLIEVLSQEDALILAPDNRGYLLAKPIKIPECPFCHDEYSNQIKGKKSSLLICGHIICTECCHKIRKDKEVIFILACPVCYLSYPLPPNPEQNRLNDFLDELPGMIRQMEETNQTKGIRGCEDCRKTGNIDAMFHCPECNSKSCGFCTYKKHQGHTAISLLEMEAGEVSKKFQNVRKGYADSFAELHKEHLEDFDALREKLASKEETLKGALSNAVLMKKQEAFKKLETSIEAMAEEYLAQLRKLGRKVKDSIRALDNSNTQQHGNI